MQDIKEKLIKKHITEIKKYVSEDNFEFVPRIKNKKFLMDNGLLVADAIDIILDISINDYYKGPESDNDGYVGQIWIFKYDFEGKMIYIKFNYNSPDKTSCISFHEDEIY
ncbi:type II toxin-antitoxin system MqsR family toxin [Proteocatella sphenisci]|uniref:type II toxin-antitoxin system MqsR family toxin n=1 Tax=Proteocatella sphenisci TaxID=181070 RepID=UPI0004BA3C1D|nr:type II toxin-antitoxin system MqsR family toxin [Proteocatella sphenisci]